MKDNLEYEQRLKTHLYQFEEQDGKKCGNQSMDDISQASERQESRVYNHRDGTPTIENNANLANQPGN